MKKFTTLLLFISLLLISSLSFSQTNADFLGTWNGTDNSGNPCELRLNANATCIFTINGNNVYSLANYRILAPSASGSDGVIQPSSRQVLLQTNIPVSANAQSGGMPAQSNQGFIIYKGELRFTDDAMSHLELSFKTDENSEPLLFSFVR